MRFGQAFGRFIFVAFLVVRGLQHLHKPDEWSNQFVSKYDTFHNSTSKHSVVKENVPSEYLELLHPSKVSTYVTQYGRYLGYTELALAASIVLSIPLLPLIGATFLAIENLVFYNPFSADFGPQAYHLAVNLALVGVVYMMAFAAPLKKVHVKAEKGKMTPEDAQRINASTEKTGRNKDFSERATKAANRNSKRS